MDMILAREKFLGYSANFMTLTQLEKELNFRRFKLKIRERDKSLLPLYCIIAYRLNERKRMLVKQY